MNHVEPAVLKIELNTAVFPNRRGLIVSGACIPTIGLAKILLNIYAPHSQFNRTNSPSLRIGSIQTGTGFLNGSISDVAIYQQVLTANQVATLYSAATGIFYNIALTNQWNGANLVLSWPGNGKLLEATNLAGPWTTNVSVSPVTVTPNQPQKFYRVQTQ